MAKTLIHFDGFELGGFNWWTVTSGSPTIIDNLNTSIEGYTSSVDEVAVYGTNWYAQTFTLSSAKSIGRISLRTKRVGTPSGLAEVSLRAVSGGVPTGPDLAYGSVIAATQINTAYAAHYWDLYPTQILSAGTYALVFRVPNGNASNYIAWSGLFTSPTYTGGQYCSSANSGSSWTGDSGKDLAFYIYAGDVSAGNYAVKFDGAGTQQLLSKSLDPNSTYTYFCMSFDIILNSTPSAECPIIELPVYYDSGTYTHRQLTMAITTARKLKLGTSTGNTVLSTGTKYRITCQIYADGAGGYKGWAWINGTAELTNITMSASVSTNSPSYYIGIKSTATFSFTADNIVCFGDTAHIGDSGDLRVLFGIPIGEGSDQNTGSGVDWQDPTFAPATYDHIDTLPLGTTDYDWAEADGAIMRYSVVFPDCGTERFSEITSSGTIIAVRFQWYYKTGGGGGTNEYYSITYDQGVRVETSIDDPTTATLIGNIETDCPSDGDPWTTTNFNTIEIGMSTDDANKDLWWYFGGVDVLYLPPAGATTHSISGTVSGAASVSGAIQATYSVKGNVSGSANVIGSISVLKKLAGTVTVTSVVTGNAILVKQLQGEISAASSVTGTIKVTKGIQGTVAASSIVTGSLLKTIGISGVVSAEAIVTGSVTVSGTVKISGIVEAASTVTGSLRTIFSVQGSISGSSTVTGIALITKELSGSTSGISTITGIALIIRGVSGSISGTSTVTGTALIARGFSGSISVASIITGNISVLRTLSGSVQAVSTVTGELTQTGEAALQGLVQAQSSVSGQISVIRRVSGQITATSIVSGSISIAGTLAVSGIIQAQATVTGTILITKELSGSISGASTVTGTILITKELSGSISGASTVTGTLSKVHRLEGSIQAQSTASGDATIQRTINLAGEVSATSSVSGALTAILAAKGTVQSISTITGELTLSGDYNLAGEVSAQSSVTGTLSAIWAAKGTVQASSSVTGKIDSIWAGKVEATSSVTGYLSRILALKGKVEATSSVSGRILGGTIKLKGYISGVSSVWGVIGAIRSVYITSWYPLDEFTTRNITEYIFPDEVDLRKFQAASQHIVPTYVPTEITPFETEKTGHYPVSFRDDFYYRIHIFEKPVSLGAIAGDMEVEFIVWNAYESKKTLESINKTGSEFTLVGQAAPFTFQPLGYEVYTIQVTEEGDPIFEAEIDFDFGATETLPVEITGNRIALLYWKPQRGIRERISSKTKVLKARDSTEQRVQIRQVPRQSFRLRVLADSTKHSTLYDSLLYKWQKLLWGIPVWTEQAEHSGSINSTDLVINIDTRFADFRDDSLALIWQSNEHYKIISIDTKTDSQLNLKSEVGADFTGDVLIVPIRLAYMISSSQKHTTTTEVSEFTAEFLIKDNDNVSGHSAEQTYDGMEVVRKPTFMEPTLKEESDAEVFVSDFETGVVELHSESKQNVMAQSHVWYNDSKEDCWKFRQFIHDKRGMQTPFLVPTFRRDFVLTNNVGLSDLTIYVQNRKFASNMKDLAIRRYIGFLINGNLIVRKIVDITEIDSTKEAIQIDVAIGELITVGQDNICFVDKVRFAFDDIEIDWPYAGRNECRATLVKVK